MITEDFGAIGTPERDEFERGCEAFIIGERIESRTIESGHDSKNNWLLKSVQRKAIFLALRMDMPTYNCLLFSKYSKDWDEK